MDDGIYVPLSEGTLRKLDQLVLRTGYDEDTIISAALEIMLRKSRQHENDNTPAGLPPDLSSDTAGNGRSAIGLSNPEMPTG